MQSSSLLNLLEKHKVVIPIIQRDYAQGRNIGKVPKIRERFLTEIYTSLVDNEGERLELDFIYGYTNIHENNEGEKTSHFIPLDGQQRLTTLFLLHWYIAVREGHSKSLEGILNKFTYSTRHSSSMFCKKLVTFVPDAWGNSLAETIIEEPWFFSAWKHDPTIASMLVMLDAIHSKFATTKDVWPKLSGDKPKIVFHLLPMDKLGLPDDLYIKMNSRGKELTEFEHFKSQFSEILPLEQAKVFNDNIDTAWSDLFWSTFKDNSIGDIAKQVDSGFLSFFWYITDILSIKNGINHLGLENGELIAKLYTDNDENCKFLFKVLNLFTELNKNEEKYFDSLFYLGEYENDKCKLFFQNAQIDLFKKCCESYGYGEQQNSFSIGEQLLFYACILHKIENNQNFNLNIRKIRNILSSSEFQLRKDNLSLLYKDIEDLVANKNLSDESKLSKSQITEENEKTEFLKLHPEFSETVLRLEDHNLLRGTISIFDLDESINSYSKAFKTIFTTDCDYFEISQALLTIGNYSQRYGKLRRFGNGTTSTWRELFTPNEYRKNFKETKRILREYLTLFVENQNISNSEIIISFNNGFDQDLAKPKNWRYYYVRYNNFKKWGNVHQTDGFYSWEDIQNKPFECNMMFRSQFNGRHWNPYLLELSYINPHCTIEHYGNKLQFTQGSLILLISMNNNSFLFSAQKEDTYSIDYLTLLISEKKLGENGELIINQDNEGHDVDDRLQMVNVFLLDIARQIIKKD